MLLHFLRLLGLVVLGLPIVCMIINIIRLKYTWHKWCVMCQLEKHVFGFKD
jgi:hypothetical protein